MNTLQLQFLMLIFAAWVNRSQQDAIEYLIEKPSNEPNMDGAAECQERVGGVLRYHYRRAA